MANHFPNPYDVLGVSPAASNAEIIKAFTLAMKQKKYPVDVIAQARKILTNPEERLIADYLRPILSPIKRFKSTDTSLVNLPTPSLELLPEFDGLEQAITQLEQISELDRRLGQKLCQNIS